MLDVLEEFLQEEAHVGFTEIQPCPFGEAYIRFTNVKDRDRLIQQGPHAFGDVFISFTKHNQGRNWRRVHFNRTCWLLFVGVPFDLCNTEDIASAISKWGKIISWEKEDALKGKILVKARVTDLGDIPKSIRWSEGELFEEESWTCSVEVLLEEMLGVGLQMRTLFHLRVWTHTLCHSMQMIFQVFNLCLILTIMLLMKNGMPRKNR